MLRSTKHVTKHSITKKMKQEILFFICIFNYVSSISGMIESAFWLHIGGLRIYVKTSDE